LLTVLFAHAAFGWAFMGWLRTRRPNAPATRWWEIAGATSLLATGAIMYSWLPLSPGYNDVSTLGGLLAAAIVLCMITAVELGNRVPAWLPALLGPLAVAMALSKWSSALATFALVGVVGILAIRRRGWREVGRVVAWAVAGLAATFLVAQVFVPLASILIDILRVNQGIAENSMSPKNTLILYRDQIIDFGGRAIRANAVLLVAALLAALARSRYLRLAAIALAVVGGAMSLYRLLAEQSYVGGAIHGTETTIALIGILLVPLVVWLTVAYRDRFVHQGADTGSSLTKPRARTWGVLIMLALLPIAQAGGSNTGLLGMAIGSLAAWVAVVIAVLTGLEAAPRAAAWLTAAAATVVLVMTTSIAVTGLWINPYLTAGRAYTTASVPGVPALAGIHLTPQTAQGYVDLYEELRPYTDPPGRAIMAFDQIAGLVLLLDGRPVGTAWTQVNDPMRTARSMRAECLGPDRWWGERAPILLFNRPMTDIERETLRICGYDFDTDYRLLAPTQRTAGFEVYVPVAG
jgi:hypothetical protein